MIWNVHLWFGYKHSANALVLVFSSSLQLVL